MTVAALRSHDPQPIHCDTNVQLIAPRVCARLICHGLHMYTTAPQPLHKYDSAIALTYISLHKVRYVTVTNGAASYTQVYGCYKRQ